MMIPLQGVFIIMLFLFLYCVLSLLCSFFIVFLSFFLCIVNVKMFIVFLFSFHLFSLYSSPFLLSIPTVVSHQKGGVFTWGRCPSPCFSPPSHGVLPLSSFFMNQHFIIFIAAAMKSTKTKFYVLILLKFPFNKIGLILGLAENRLALPCPPLHLLFSFFFSCFSFLSFPLGFPLHFLLSLHLASSLVCFCPFSPSIWCSF